MLTTSLIRLLFFSSMIYAFCLIIINR